MTTILKVVALKSVFVVFLAQCHNSFLNLHGKLFCKIKMLADCFCYGWIATGCKLCVFISVKVAGCYFIKYIIPETLLCALHSIYDILHTCIKALHLDV